MMRELEIERQFDIKIENLKPNRGVYLLKTNKGPKCMKKVDYGTQKLLFVYGAKEHLINNGFDRVDKYCLNIEGNPYAMVNEDIYTLSEWIEGRECDFKNVEELALAARSLAQMHIASEGYEPPENSKLKTDLERWPKLMEKRIKSFEKMRNMCRKKSNKTEFDLNYLKSYNFFKEIGISALEELEQSQYMNLCKETEEKKGFCHHDYTCHNIMIDTKEKYNIIDFDYCKREIRAYDISAFMIKVLKRVDWDIEYAELILKAYSEISPLRDEELKVIYAFLIFPQRFWRLCNRYYYNEVNWPVNTYSNKILQLINEQDKYMEFVNEFKKRYAL